MTSPYTAHPVYGLSAGRLGWSNGSGHGRGEPAGVWGFYFAYVICETDFGHHLARTDPFERADSPPSDGVRSKI